MKINNIQNLMTFRAHYTNVDIGASSILGSMKIRTTDEYGNIISSEKTTVFDNEDERSEDKFEQKLADKISDYEYENYLHDDDMYLTVCYPGPKVRKGEQQGFMMSNFYYDNERINRFQSPVLQDKIDSYLAQNGVTIAQTRHVNDMAGAGACILSKIQEKYPELLNEGKDIVYLYPGGGLGSGVISVDKNDIKIKPTEIQHTRKDGFEDKSLEQDVGAYGIVINFARKLNLTFSEKEKLGTNVKAVTEFEEAKKYLPDLTEKEYNEALKYAVENYMQSIAKVIAIQICALKTNSVILTGQIANGIKDAVNNNSEFEKNEKFIADDKFSSILKEKINENLTLIGQKLYNPDDFDIKFLQLKDNTEGSEILQRCDEVGKPAAWYNMIK